MQGVDKLGKQWIFQKSSTIIYYCTQHLYETNMFLFLNKPWMQIFITPLKMFLLDNVFVWFSSFFATSILSFNILRINPRLYGTQWFYIKLPSRIIIWAKPFCPPLGKLMNCRLRLWNRQASRSVAVTDYYVVPAVNYTEMVKYIFPKCSHTPAGLIYGPTVRSSEIFNPNIT